MDGEAMDDELEGPQRQELRLVFDNHNVLMDEELADSDEDDTMDVDDAQEQIIAFAERNLGVARAPLSHHPLHPLTSK